MDGKLLKDILQGGLDNQGWGIKKLTEVTSIQERYVRLLLDGDLKKLPPSPYVRGYLTKICQALELDMQDVWQTYKNEINGGSSGPFDRLPINRFAIQSKAKKFLTFGILVILVIIYLSWNFRQLIGSPTLQVIFPEEETTVTNEPLIIIEGSTEYSNKLTINNEQIYLKKNGQFKKEYDLQEGINTFEILAKKFLGREIKIIKKVIRHPPAGGADQKLVEEEVKDIKQDEKRNE